MAEPFRRGEVPQAKARRPALVAVAQLRHGKIGRGNRIEEIPAQILVAARWSKFGHV